MMNALPETTANRKIDKHKSRRRIAREFVLQGVYQWKMAGGTAEQVGHALALALKSTLGLVCDPVAGLVEVPCVKRNAFGAVQAVLAADLALSGVESVIPADEVIAAMYEIGLAMPSSLRETSQAGLARTKTAKAIEERLYGKQL